MPDLSADSVQTWFAISAPGLDHLDHLATRPIEQDPVVAEALARLGAALDEARFRDGPGLDATLATEPARSILRAILAQLGFHRMTRLMAWLAESPGGSLVLQGLLDPADRSGAGDLLRMTLGELHRQALVARLYAAERLEALLAACDPAPEEAAR
jgi:hypothetical protein